MSPALQVAHAADRSLLTLTTESETVEVRLAHFADDQAWFLRRDGGLNRLHISDVKRLSKSDERFQPWDKATIRNSLRRDFGSGLRVGGGPRYLVCARDEIVEPCSELLDESYGLFSRFFSTRGFDLEDCEFALVVVILPDRKTFESCCRKDGVPVRSELRGYYSPRTNRIMMYEELSSSRVAEFQAAVRSSARNRNKATLSGSSRSLHATLVHEAVHQLGFNRGLHSRLARNPRWVVEGIAMVLESKGVRSGERDLRTGVNAERNGWWHKYRNKTDRPIEIRQLVVDEQIFTRQTLDAYSEAWAWSYFLLMTRSSRFSEYLQLVAEREPGTSYGAEERLSDFQSVFGDDLSQLQRRFEQFMGSL